MLQALQGTYQHQATGSRQERQRSVWPLRLIGVCGWPLGAFKLGCADIFHSAANAIVPPGDVAMELAEP